MSELLVGGFEPLSVCDWPGQLAATVFCQGCPWRCGYCHNPHLLPVRGAALLSWPATLDFLRRRRGLLDAVVFSGGEPTLQKGLVEAVVQVRALGFRIGLHTGGAYPSRLAQVLPLVDWVGFDVKTAFDDYDDLTRARGSGRRARASLRLLLDSGKPHDLRTTIHPRLHPASRLDRLREDLEQEGAGPSRLQAFRSTGCLDSGLHVTDEEMEWGPA